MNDRLEIASRLMAALFDFTGEPKGHAEPTPPHMALMWADALIAEEARTRPPAGDATNVTAALRQLEGAAGDYAEFHGGCQHHPDDCPGKDEECVVRIELRKAFDAAKHALAASPPRADAPAPDDLRAVAEELLSALDDAVDVGIEGHATTKKALAALCRARAMGLGGGK